MNKKSILLKIVLIVIMIVSLCPKVYAKDVPTLDDIVNLFNVCKTVKKINQDGTETVTASVITNGIRLSITDVNKAVENLDYEFNSTANVLTAQYVGGNSVVRDYWIKYTEILVDCIEQFHGYAEGEFFDTLHTTQVENYTLANQGLVIETNSPNRYYAQIDIAKVIPTLDVHTYIKEEDLTDLKNNISGDGIAKFKKVDIVFYKYTVNDKDIITIGELGDFTYKIDKSILTILKVMFDKNDPVEYFKNNYPSVEIDKSFAGFTVEVNPIKNDTEQYIFAQDTDYKFVRITVDRAAVTEALNTKKENKEPEVTTPVQPTPITNTITNPGTGSGGSVSGSTGGGSSTGSGNTGTLPKTGKEINWGVMSLYGIFGVAVLGVILIGLNKKETK